MKLLGTTDGVSVVASLSRYDYVRQDRIMADGGQPGTMQYGGYSRFSGKRVWFEVPQTYAELYYDYNCNHQDRKYGIWKVEDVKILNEDEYPDTDDFNYLVSNAIWGTRGKCGTDPLKYVHLIDCEKEHLENILNTGRCSDELTQILQHLIDAKNECSNKSLQQNE